MKKFHPRSEPILYIGLAIAILQVVQGFMAHQPISQQAFDSIVTLAGAIMGRSLVTSVITKPQKENQNTYE